MADLSSRDVPDPSGETRQQSSLVPGYFPFANGIFSFQGKGKPIGERLSDTVETVLATIGSWIISFVRR